MPGFVNADSDVLFDDLDTRADACNAGNGLSTFARAGAAQRDGRYDRAEAQVRGLKAAAAPWPQEAAMHCTKRPRRLRRTQQYASTRDWTNDDRH